MYRRGPNCLAPNCGCITPCDIGHDCRDCGRPISDDQYSEHERCDDCATEYRSQGVAETLGDVEPQRFKVSRRQFVYRACRVCLTVTPLRLTAFGPDGIESVDLCSACISQVQGAFA